MADALTEILRAASKHPNSRVSKLIHLVEEERTQKNIVLLLIELAEHAEYSIDFNISLKYYLNLFERLGINHELVLNEAGLLLVNSSKIYSKRVDYVQSLVERQILTLSNADDELQKQKLEQQQTENSTSVEKPKRGRKRALEAPTDPYEIELSPKKFKKLTEEKRFAAPKTVPKTKPIFRNIEMEQHIHPACWQYATIYDFENEEDVDTKRNYKLFTYHVEHRYNTLVPDINFRLHFKVKDYIDELEEMEENEASNTDCNWPPLSEAYVEKYLRLENYVLQQDMKRNKTILVDYLERQEQQSVAADANIDPADNLQQILNSSSINESISFKNNVDLEKVMFDSSTVNTTSELSLINTTLTDSGISNLKEKNDSGLGQSLLDESNNTLNSTSENSIITDEINSNITDANKSLNANESQTENDSALGSSVLDQSGGNIENNKTENLNFTTYKENPNVSDLKEVNSSLNVANSQLDNDSVLGPSVLDQSSNNECNTTAEHINSNITEGNTSLNANGNQSENDSPLETSILDQNGNGENNTTEVNSLNVTECQLEIDSALNRNLQDSTKAEITENIETTKQLSENIEASALNDDQNMSSENLNQSKIDVKEQQDKSTTQIRVQLPNGDDEGVYLSDLEEQYDSRLLSSVVIINNILPGVERKDVTILMDEELRQALEMRDDIMKHFGGETFTVPVITETKKPNLVFNILKLPEKILRKRVLFKLGPEMDVYLQARSLKRSRLKPVTQVSRRGQFMQWFSLNNTDLTDVFMSPPYSPGHFSDFCGFSEENDDAASCAEFCGFTEEEQSKLTLKAICRLSRDSGVGADVNNVTPEKELFEIKFEGTDNLRLRNCNRNLDNTESVENMLTQLPAEIRDVLTRELEIISENISTTVHKNEETAADNKSKINEDLLSSNVVEEMKKSGIVLTENCSDNNTKDCSENTESLLSSNKDSENSNQNTSSVNIGNSSTNNTQVSDINLIEKCSETRTCTEESVINNEPISTSEYESTTGDSGNDIEIPNSTTALQYTDSKISCNENSNTEKHIGTDEDLSEVDITKSTEQDSKLHYHQPDAETNDSDDYVMLDLDTQGNKTKIQQWHDHLQPILAKSRERHHFDVYKLGTEIIETVQSKGNELKSPDTSSSNHNMTSLDDIMENKDKSYVSRYFLSTLLLANQSNIEILIKNKSSEKPTEWHDINLKLLSTKRHTVAIEDNIGMIDSKQKIKANQNNRIHNHQGEDSGEDEPLIKLQMHENSSIKVKTSLKRSSSDDVQTSILADKKRRETLLERSTINSRHKALPLPNLIESVEIIKPTFSNASLTMDTLVIPSTSRHAHKTNSATFNVNVNAIRTLQPIEKVKKTSDDIDSGVFSIDEMSTS